MTYPSNEEVEKRFDREFPADGYNMHLAKTMRIADKEVHITDLLCGKTKRRERLLDFISSTRLSDLDAIAKGVKDLDLTMEEINNGYKAQTRILSYLTQLKKQV